MAETPRYVCWEAHAEDLTEKVENALAGQDDGPHLYFKRGRGGTKKKAKVFVECSAGHLNVFDVPPKD